MNIRVVIIDDEPKARETIIFFLQSLNYPLEVVGEAWDIDSSLKIIERTKPELIFLDIQLKDGTGFEVLEKIPENTAQIIFVTAYDQHAVKAFQMCAFGYLLKPLAMADLEMVIKRFLEDHKVKKQQLVSHTKILIEHFDNKKVKKLVLQNVNGFKIVNVDQIIYLKGEVNYTRFYLANGELVMTSRTLKEYDNILQDFGFFRIHQSFLVNLSFVTEYIKGEGGIAIMKNGDQLSISRRRKKQFVKKFIS